VIAIAGVVLAIAYPLGVRERLLRTHCEALGNLGAAASRTIPPRARAWGGR